jgi:phage-related protein
MTRQPDEIRDDIERTRRKLSADVDALTEKVSPGRVVGRRVERARGVMTQTKNKIMGSAEGDTYAPRGAIRSTASGVADQVSSAASTVADTVASVPLIARERTQGNPLAAGLIAFGAGWLISSLLPATGKEQQVAAQVKETAREQAQPVAQQLSRVAQQVKENLSDPARQAVESVKSTASDAGSTIADQTRSAAGNVAQRAEQAKDAVQEQASDSGSSPSARHS